MELTKNTILITGGTAGIGLTLGKTLMNLGNTVILLGRNKEKLAEAEKKGFMTIACDLCNQDEIENAALHIQNHFPQINMLFNNAGVQYNYDFKDHVIPLDKIAKEIETNLIGQLILTQLLIPILSNAKISIIVNTTSGLGAFPKVDGLVYSASKAAMRSFTTGLRYSLKETSICVLEFIPPVTDTGMTRERDEKKMSSEELVKRILPQLRKERKILTIPKMRMFLWIAFLFPTLAHKIVSKS
jgi:uncharacterized oxidoreductase